MLPSPVTITLVDNNGNPIDGLAVTLIAYVSKLGVPRAPPPVTNLPSNPPNGRYTFQPTKEDAVAGIAWVMETPGASVSYMFDLIYDPIKPFISVFLTDGAGGLSPAAPPIWKSYTDPTDAPLTPPNLIPLVAPYLWGAVPLDADLVGGVHWSIDTQGAFPSFYEETARAILPMGPPVGSVELVPTFLPPRTVTETIPTLDPPSFERITYTP